MTVIGIAEHGRGCRSNSTDGYGRVRERPRPAPCAPSFSSGTYHHPLMGLLVALAGFGWVRPFRSWLPIRPGERRIHGTLVALFARIQTEYAYHTASPYEAVP